MSNLILNEKKGAGTYITINRPDNGGRVSDEMAAKMATMIDEAGTDSKYIIFRSAGPDFCVGRDNAGRRARDCLLYTSPSPRD